MSLLSFSRGKTGSAAGIAGSAAGKTGSAAGKTGSAAGITGSTAGKTGSAEKSRAGALIKSLICIAVALALIAAGAPKANAVNVKIAAFTFDDGPHTTYTPRLLDGLRERNVRATFFVIGQNIANKRHLITRMYDEGHQIANHTWTHSALTSLSDAQIRNEIARTADLLTEITGLTDFLVRPPLGAVSSRVAAAAGVPLIMWNVDPTGGVHPTAQATMTSRLISSVRDGAIIILHDTSAANVNSALDAIDTLKARGFEFVTLNELFRLKGVTPGNGNIYYSAYNASPASYDESLIDRHWAAAAIRFVEDTGIMGGDGTGFSPNRPMTRGVAVTVLWRMATIGGLSPPAQQTSASQSPSADQPPPGGQSGPPGAAGAFEDVPAGQWYTQGVEWACANGIAGGYSDTVFGTNDNISREQFYAMLDRCRVLFNVQMPSVSPAASYIDDARISVWARQSVMNLRNAGFESLNDVEIFRPGDDITRAESAELIMWFMLMSRTPAAPA